MTGRNSGVNAAYKVKNQKKKLLLKVMKQQIYIFFKCIQAYR